MKQHRRYQKLFSRDFSLPSVEAWVRGESTNHKEWTRKKQPFLPYIITDRSDDTVHFYYDPEGVAWVQELLVQLARERKDFIPTVADTVLKKLRFIQPIYEREETVDLPTLRRFLKELEAGYPWFESMWWFFQMDDESKTDGLDLAYLTQVRKRTDALCNSSDTVIRKSLATIFPKLGELSSVLRTSEIVSGQIPAVSVLKTRNERYFFADNQLFTDTSTSEIEKLLGVTFEREHVKKVRQLRGTPAYAGIVRGFVRRVMGHKQIGEFKEGEILLSPMTIPDFIPALKKAAAIVTDEGGMLSHAAIIAREFEKPTVVGTSIATKRFKDGDIVEVNATEGRINLICHASIVANTLKKPCIISTQFATDMFEDGDYIEVNADKGIITLINKKDAVPKIKKIIPWDAMFHHA